MARKAKAKVEAEGEVKASLSAADRLKSVLALFKDSDTPVGVASDPEMKQWLEYERISTGFPALDVVLDGGFPKGKFSVIAGPEQSCKTTLCLYTIADRMRKHPDALWGWVDAENSFDPKWAANAGVDLDRLVVFKPTIMEDMLQSLIEAIATGNFDGVVIDSVGGLTPLAEIKKKKDDKSMTRTLTDDSMAGLAKKIGQFFRMCNETVFQTKTCCLLIGHVYTPIGNDYVEYEVKGGNALKHWAHLRVLCRRRKGDQDAKMDLQMPSGQKKAIFVGYEAVFMVDKTRQGAHQGHEVSIPFIFGKGLSNTKSVIQSAFAYGVITMAGAWCSHPALQIGRAHV